MAGRMSVRWRARIPKFATLVSTRMPPIRKAMRIGHVRPPADTSERRQDPSPPDDQREEQETGRFEGWHHDLCFAGLEGEGPEEDGAEGQRDPRGRGQSRGLELRPPCSVWTLTPPESSADAVDRRQPTLHVDPTLGQERRGALEQERSHHDHPGDGGELGDRRERPERRPTAS